MDNNTTQQWREEFERLIKYEGTIRFSGGVYADNRLHQKWIGFKTSKRNSDKEISQLKEEIDKLNNKTKNIETNRMFWVNETCKLKNTFGILKEIKRYPTALGYISELKEELEKKKVFLSKVELQISKGYPTAKEWHLLAMEFQKQRN